jgi:hypothetical protein
MTDFIQLETTCESRFPFACSACGFWANAVLRVKSTGSATVNATSANAHGVAARPVDRIAERNLARSRDVVRCPNCRAFDPERLARYRLNRVIVGGVWLATGVVVALVAFMITGTPNLLVFLAGAVALCSSQPLYQAISPPNVYVTFHDAMTPPHTWRNAA